MSFCDFVVRYDPEHDSQDDLIKRIFYAVFIKRIKANMPIFAFIGGESGSGKSLSSITIQQILLELQNIDLKDFIDDINVYTPIEYPTKLDKLLFDPKLKDLNMLTIHEAREVVKAKMWQSFLTQAIADVNAMSRSVKRLIVLIISQFIRDITTDIRYTLNFYMTVRRPKSKRARLYINVMWKDDRDLEKPKLRKRKLQGYLIDSMGRYKRYIPQYFELPMPNPELVKIFEEKDRKAKADIIRHKLDKLLKEMKSEINMESNKIDNMIEWYLRDRTQLKQFTTKRYGKLQLKESIKEMHELTEFEVEKFEKLLNEKLKKEGYFGDTNEAQGTDKTFEEEIGQQPDNGEDADPLYNEIEEEAQTE